MDSEGEGLIKRGISALASASAKYSAVSLALLKSEEKIATPALCSLYYKLSNERLFKLIIVGI